MASKKIPTKKATTKVKKVVTKVVGSDSLAEKQKRKILVDKLTKMIKTMRNDDISYLIYVHEKQQAQRETYDW